MKQNRNKPIIGIVPTYRSEDSAILLPERYIRAITKAGGAPVILPFTPDVKVYESLLPTIDGFLLSGGQDIDPVRYGGDITYGKMTELTPDREEVEYLILSFAKQYNVPVLGICRGMQMINVSFGGTLYQDIDEQFLSSADIEAGSEADGATDTAAAHLEDEAFIVETENATNQEKKRLFESSHWQTVDYKTPAHSVTIAEDSKLFEILGSGKLAVNSMHHQGIRELGEGLLACARDKNGLIEAIEACELDFMIGVQWHPEFMIQERAMSNLFGALVNSAESKNKCAAGCPTCIHIMREEREGCWPCIRIDEINEALDAKGL